MHSSRICTVRNSSRLLSGGSLHTHPPEQTPQSRHALGAGTPPAARHAGIQYAMHAGIAHTPLCEQNHRRV